MTIAVVWREHEALWAVADTRFSAPGVTTAAQRITDHGPKLYPLAVTVWQPGSRGFFDSVRLRTSIGYVYAGVNGPALATHALCAAVLQHLQVTNNCDPSLCEIAEFIRATAERFMRNWGERWPNHWEFTALIFGWCNVNQRLETYQLAASLRDRIVVTSQCVDASEPVAIGSGVAEFVKELGKLRTDGDAFGRTARLPLLAVEQLVAHGIQDDVGGDVQIGCATTTGLQIMNRVRPEVPGQSKAMITFLGIDTLELGGVGPCRIGLTSLA